MRLADVAFVGRQPGAARRTQHYRARAIWRAPSWWETTPKISAILSACFESRDAVRVVGPAEFPLTLMELLSERGRTRAPGPAWGETLRSQTGATTGAASGSATGATLRTVQAAGTSPARRANQSESPGSLFGVVVGARNALYDRGVLRARRLSGPVVSIGNLSVGGSGKTPFVLIAGRVAESARNQVRHTFPRLRPQDPRRGSSWIPPVHLA